MTKKIKSRKIVKYYYYEEKEVDKKRVAYLLFLLLMTAVLLSTSTYAWFTVNRVVSIEELNLKVQTEGSLEISVDGFSWKPGLELDDIISAHNNGYSTSVNQLPNIIEPVSTAGKLSNNGFMDFYLGEVKSNDEGEYILTSKRSIETEGNGDDSLGNFIAFDIFLRSTEGKALYLTSESDITYGGNESVGIENAMRGAFILEGNTPSGDSIARIQSLSTSDSNNVYIWEPNYDVHTSNGVSNARDTYGITTTLSNAQRLEYDGIIAEFGNINNITLKNANGKNYPTLFSNVTPKIVTTSNNGSYQFMFNLNPGISKVRVYLWLEGQDVDCENNASIGGLSIKLQFSTNPS